MPRARVYGSFVWALSALFAARVLTVPDAHPWFKTWIPALFHLLLAAFVLIASFYHLSGPAPTPEEEP